MKNSLFLLVLFAILHSGLWACTNLIVTKGASADSATYLVYLNDGEWLYHLHRTPAQNHSVTDSLSFISMSGKEHKVHQIAHTNAIIGFLMNEHQLAIGESTFVGREELWDKDQPLKYWELMRLALLRAKTAREAIECVANHKPDVVVMDIRHPLNEYDCQMLQWCHHYQLPTHIVLTKADKLKRGAQQTSKLQTQKQLKEAGINASVQIFSALKKTGLDELVMKLNEWLEISS